MKKIIAILTVFVFVFAFGCSGTHSEETIDTLAVFNVYPTKVRKLQEVKIRGTSLSGITKVIWDATVLDVSFKSDSLLVVKAPLNEGSGFLKCYERSVLKFQKYIKVIDDSWKVLKAPKNFSWIRFKNNQVGFALDENNTGEENFYSTTDGGVTWKKILATNYTNGKFYMGNAGDLSIPVMLGQRGFIRSLDNGKTWKAIKLPFTVIKSIRFIDLQKGYVLLFNKKNSSYELMVTESGGSNWKLVYRFKNSLEGFQIGHVKNNHFLLVGKNKVLYRSLDGGSSWTKRVLALPIGEFTVEFKSSTNVWGVSKSSKELFKSFDGGASFEKVDSIPLKNKIVKVVFDIDAPIFAMSSSGECAYFRNKSSWEVYDVLDDVYYPYFRGADMVNGVFRIMGNDKSIFSKKLP